MQRKVGDSMGDTKQDGKSLGAVVPEQLYWDFKDAAAKRKESMQEAIIHAARMYVDVESDAEEANNG